MAKLEVLLGGSKTHIPKNFYRTGGSNTYIPKNFYTKTTCTTLLSEKFRGSDAPPDLFNATPMQRRLPLDKGYVRHGSRVVVLRYGERERAVVMARFK
ncbi:hypothetical protein Hanom_Chr16g01483771 [Helianthus anomalus]